MAGRWVESAYCLALTLVLACGGVAEQPRGSEAASGRDSGGAANNGAGGGVSIPSAGSGGTPSGINTGLVCRFPQPSCDSYDSYIEIDDQPAARLSFPLDTSCGICQPSCANCPDPGCQIWASGTSSCGSLSLSVAACARPDGAGACLDLASPDPSYTDSAGQRWTPLALNSANPAVDEQVNGPIDLDLTLVVSGNGISRQLPVHAHFCAAIADTAPPCK